MVSAARQSPSFVQKEEGLREEHGSARQIARGPRRGAARRFRRNARDRKGELANPKGLTEGLWVSYRSGQPVTGRFLLYRTYNPSASHPLSTSPYTGEASPAGLIWGGVWEKFMDFDGFFRQKGKKSPCDLALKSVDI